MSQDVAEYIAGVGPEWQAEICRALDGAVRRALPGATARLQYGKPHYLVGKQYAAAIGTAKGWVSFTIFNAAGLTAPDGLFEPGPPERKTIKVKPGQAVDYGLIAGLVREAAGGE